MWKLAAMLNHWLTKKKKTEEREEKMDQADENGSRGNDAEWLAGTNVEAMERQKQFRQRLSENVHRTSKKRSRPKRRSSDEPRAAGLQHPKQNVGTGTKQPPIDKAVPVIPVVQEKPTSFPSKNESETDDEDLQDDPPRPVEYYDDLSSDEEFYAQKETEVSSDDEELDWYEKSVKKFQHGQTADVEEEEIHLSHRQKKKFEKRRRPDRVFYKTLINDENELDKIIKKDPKKYKRCILKIESSHKSIAKVLEKGSDAVCEILINGRSKCGQSYMDDEVVVEIVNPRRAGDARFEQSSRSDVRRDTDNLVYGAVLGMYPSKRKRFKDVDHPVLICTLDEMEDHLMKPLCKTIPKVHVMNNKIRKKYGWNVKNRVEIKRIVGGNVQNKGIMKIDPEKRDLYIFRVVLLTWSLQTIYPLGAVIDAGIGGTDFSGGLEVLCLQQQVRKLYPRNVLQEVDNLQAETVMLGRRDFTKEKVFTIDPPGSKDLDDALSIKKEGDDFVVGVHIADVASVVEKGSEVDEEAKKRAVTFYPLCRRPYPMLPEPLSHGKCSLLPNQNRPAVSVFFQFDKNGILQEDTNPQIERTIIKSCRQFTYNEVQRVITNCGSPDTREFAWDIHHLHMIASKLRENRIKDRKHYVPFEDPRIGDLHDTDGDVEAHALVEEFMILTNLHIAKCLKSNPLYANVLILRSHKSPTRQQLAEWRHKEGNVANLVFKLQGKKTSPGNELSLAAGSDRRLQAEYVVVQENIWAQLARCFETRKWAEARKLACADALHPLQCLANEHWIEMMETAEYKCAYGLNEPDVSHFDLEVTCYTHFTSPIRRYADLHVHRLLHAYLDGQPPDATPEEVIQLCLHLTSATSRQKAFSRGCRTLWIASSLEQNPLVFRAYVNKVDSERLGLYLPSLQSISDRKQELPFSMLGVTSQPEVTTDKQDKVTVKWNVKIYNNKDTCPVDFQTYVRQRGKTEGILTIDICSHQLSVLVLQKDWIATLRNLSNERGRWVSQCLSKTGVKYITSELGKACSDSNSEDGDNNEIRSCLFKTQFSPGQVLQVQMSAKPSRGLLSPQLELVQLTRNVTICTRHLKDSVSCLSRPATRVVREKYFKNHEDYLGAWMPLLEMEAAAEAGDSGLGIMIENVRVTMKKEASSSGSDPAVFRGTFRLPTTFCFNRCIEFGGAEPESLKDNEELKGTPSCPLDYLCIRYQLNCNSVIKSKAQASLFAPVIDTHYTWVGHAGVVSAKKVTAGGGGKKKSDSKKTKAKDKKQHDKFFVEVTFLLTQNSPKPPSQLLESEGADVFLEIMSKSEVTRRAQEMLYEINKEGCELAQALAYGTSSVPPPLDGHHLNLGTNSSCEVHVRGLSGQKLPGNNSRQAKAIRTALTNTLSTIQGPPGTGKSYTGVKLVYLFNQINRKLERQGERKKTILFCGPSNKSVDHVAKTLKERLGTSCPKMVRMYGSAIETKDYPIPQTNMQTRRGTKDLKSDKSLQDISLHHIIRRDGNKHAEEIKRLDNLFARCLEDPKTYKVTREDLESHRELVNKASVEELGNYEVILTTCAMGGNKKLVKGTKERIFQVIIDECAMSPEPLSLVPIVANKAKQVVLIGDHKQLRPIIRCKQAAELGLDQSLFERLYEKYRNQRVFLNRQYRMHPKICEFPSRAFYDGKLITESSSLWEGEPLPFWTSDPSTRKKIPHLLVDIKGNEEMLTVSTEEGNEKSKSNVQEVEKVAEIFVYLKKEFKLDVASIKILSQYNAQRNLIEQKLIKLCEDREVFDRYDQHKVNVSTVVSSQGGEWDYVIVSTVRSLPSYKIEPHATLGWCHQNMGFITDQNQVNVALTRARRGLIIVGDKELLKCDPLWKDLVQSYSSEHCIKKAHEFPRRRRHRNPISSD